MHAGWQAPLLFPQGDLQDATALRTDSSCACDLVVMPLCCMGAQTPPSRLTECIKAQGCGRLRAAQGHAHHGDVQGLPQCEGAALQAGHRRRHDPALLRRAPRSCLSTAVNFSCYEVVDAT